MARAIGIVAKYIVFPGVLATALMQIAKPSEEELQKIKAYTPKNEQFSAVLKAAAQPNSKPIYQQKPGEQHPIPGLADTATKR